MLKKVVKYNDFDGNERIDTLFFNLTQIELTEMAMDLPEDIQTKIGDDPNKVDRDAAFALIETLGGKGILDFIKKLVLKSYGIKSEDGYTFEKSEEISRRFSHTLAFDTIVMELMSDENTAANFVNSVMDPNAAKKINSNNMAMLPLNK